VAALALVPLGSAQTAAPEQPASSPVFAAAAPGAQRASAIAWNGSSHLVVWEDDRGATWDVYAARVSAAGVVQESYIAVSTAPGDQRAPAVTAGGSTTLIAWEDFRLGSDCDVRAARIAANGSIVDADGFVVTNLPNSQFAPDAAWDGTNFLVAWSDWVSAVTWDIRATRVAPAAAVLDTPLVVSNAANDQTEPSVAWDGTSFVVAWADRRSGSGDVYAGRVTAAGTVQDGSGFVLSNAANEQVLPAVAAAGGTVLATWGDSRGSSEDVYGARIDSGSVLDASGRVVSSKGRKP
jgi:hypothetical protein